MATFISFAIFSLSSHQSTPGSLPFISWKLLTFQHYSFLNFISWFSFNNLILHRRAFSNCSIWQCWIYQKLVRPKKQWRLKESTPSHPLCSGKGLILKNHPSHVTYIRLMDAPLIYLWRCVLKYPESSPRYVGMWGDPIYACADPHKHQIKSAGTFLLALYLLVIQTWTVKPLCCND